MIGNTISLKELSTRSILVTVSFGILFLFLAISHPTKAATYEYDQYYRLARYQNGSLLIVYMYDSAGNRLSTVRALGDSDMDGISDIIESKGCTDQMDADTDDDGVLDGAEDLNQNNLVDSGETDPCNSDTDGDGLQDGTELGMQAATSPDTSDTFTPDQDPTTRTDPLNSDSDFDWISDGTEDTNKNGRVDQGESDPLDQETFDTDNDGLFDALENQTCTLTLQADTDGDTIIDGDEDSNHNGIRDQGETDPCNEDTDGDGDPDNSDATPTGEQGGASKILPSIFLMLLQNDSN